MIGICSSKYIHSLDSVPVMAADTISWNTALA